MPAWLYIALPIIATVILIVSARTDYRCAVAIADTKMAKTIPLVAIHAWAGLVMSYLLRVVPATPEWAHAFGQSLLPNLFALVGIGAAAMMMRNSWRVRRSLHAKRFPAHI